MQKSFKKYFSGQYLLLGLLIFCPFFKASSQEYFQQEVNFTINVTLNDRKHELSGNESVEYINNSPDTLGFLYFHLWPNGYSGNKTQLADQLFRFNGKSKLFSDPELNGYIDSLNFEASGLTLQWNKLPGLPDICKVVLNSPLKPGDTIILTTPFHVKIPKGVSSRLGHIGESYQISQWYPKPAVYDKSGWHQMPYLDQGEFFSEFGSFDVSITLPENYTVGATGDLRNEEEMKRLEAISAETSRMETIYSPNNSFPPSSARMKTLRYKQNNIHDFAWFADKRFHVLKGKLTLPGSDREITTWIMFTNQEAQLWVNAISYVNNAIWYFSKWIGDYPYNSFTAVQSALTSGAGMEYPGLTVIGTAGDPYLLDQVLAHEICHTWFYSAIGSDERRYPFMDESIATAYETRYTEVRYPGKKLWEIDLKSIKLARFFRIENMPVERIQELDWLVPARSNFEQPGNLAAPDYNYINYGSIVYNKMAMGFSYLRGFLGDSLFDSIMHDYYLTWQSRHPGPDDLRKVFESGSSKDLSWFFDDFLGTTRRLDYKLVRFTGNKVLVQNRGEMVSPVVIAGIKKDSIVIEKWVDGFTGKKWIDIGQGDYTELKIDPQHKTTELFRLNNNLRTSGIFPKADPFQLQFLYTVEDPDKRSFTFIPAFDWNSADGFMAGMAMHNGILIPKPAEYFIMPFYTFRNPGISGYGRISFNITPYDNFIRLMTFSIEGARFGAPGNQNYQKAKAGLDFNLRSAKMIDPVNKKIFVYYLAASDLTQITSQIKAGMRSYFNIGYQMEMNGAINPYKMVLSFETGKSYQKTALEINYRYSYYGRNRGLDMRLFTGMMLKNNSEDPFYAFSPGGRSGPELYTFEGVYPDRFSSFPQNFWSRQMTLSEGGLVTFVNDTLGYSKWLCSFSITSSLPGKASMIPVKPFINVLINDHGLSKQNNSKFFFEAGLKAGAWDFFEIYIPMLYSHNISAIAGSYKERIRFVFRLDKINPLRKKL
jgi:hypothetical protein